MQIYAPFGANFFYNLFYPPLDFFKILWYNLYKNIQGGLYIFTRPLEEQKIVIPKHINVNGETILPVNEKVQLAMIDKKSGIHIVLINAMITRSGKIFDLTQGQFWKPGEAKILDLSVYQEEKRLMTNFNTFGSCSTP